MKNLFKKLSRTEDRGWRDEIERQAAEEIRSVGGQRPPEAASQAPRLDEAAPPASPEHVPVAATPPPAGRRLTAQQRAAARQLQ